MGRTRSAAIFSPGRRPIRSTLDAEAGWALSCAIMARRDRDTGSSLGGKVLGLAIINIIPLGGLGYFIWALATGRNSLDDLPAGLGRNAACFGVTVVLLLIIASGLLPLCHGLARGMLGRLRYSAEMRRQGGVLRKFGEFLLWPFRFVTYLSAASLRFVLLVTGLALTAAAILFIVRFFEPEALESQLQVDHRLEVGLDWLRERIGR